MTDIRFRYRVEYHDICGAPMFGSAWAHSADGALAAFLLHCSMAAGIEVASGISVDPNWDLAMQPDGTLLSRPDFEAAEQSLARAREDELPKVMVGVD